MINIKNLSLKVDKLTIFENADINIPKDKITVLVGPNGVGKTTLLKIISGIINEETKFSPLTTSLPVLRPRRSESSS